MRISATIQDGATRALKAYTEQAAVRSQAAVDAAAVLVKERSQELVPVDTGELKESCEIVSTGQGFERVSKVTYKAKHALHVHEDLTADHPNGGQAKFLEQAMREAGVEVMGILAKALQ